MREAIAALDQLDAYIKQAEEALATTPKGDNPEIRDKLGQVIDAAKPISAELRSRVEAGDVAGIQQAIDAAGPAQQQTAQLLAEIQALGHPMSEPPAASDASTSPDPATDHRCADGRTDR